MAHVQSIENRRRNRRSAARIQADRTRRRRLLDASARCAREREVVRRLLRRFWPDGAPHLVCCDYRYWQLRRCGWDLLSPAFAVDEAGRPLDCDSVGVLRDPESSSIWRWWIGLHWTTRLALCRFRLKEVREKIF